MIPWLVGVVAVATVGYMASSDDDDYDDYEECRYCSSEVYIDNMCRRHYREEQEEAREKTKIQSEIDTFKDISKKQIGSKYNVDISFNGKNVLISDSDNGQIAHLKTHISEQETENKDIEKLIKDLQSEKRCNLNFKNIIKH